MPRPLPAVGDIVKVYLVGTVTALGAPGVTVTTPAGAAALFPPALRDDDGFAWEVVPVAEPVYVPGQIYIDAAGNTFLRNDTDYPGDRWTVILLDDVATGQHVAEDRPVRPLKRLIPEV